MAGTFWAFVPAIVAIILALITKQVYVSLFVGIFVGAMFYTNGHVINALGTLFGVMGEKVGENTAILVFLVILGIFVVLMQKSGGAKAYGDWAQTKIKSKKGALGATAALGCLIFVDDYFNCLTVGSVMRPVTDKFKISHSKLAYIIDATAAPVCIIAPISSWAAAVGGSLEVESSIMEFIKTIPFNIYALLTIVMVFILCYTKFDFGKMKKNEIIAETTGDLDVGETETSSDTDASIISNPKGKVRHLIVPVVILILCCIGGMIYSGYFYNWGSTFELNFDSAAIISSQIADGGTIVTINNTEGMVEFLNKAKIFSEKIDGVYYTVLDTNTIQLFINSVEATISETSIFVEYEAAGYGTTLQSGNLIEAFSNCDAGSSLAIGSIIALVIVSIYYMATKVTSFKDITDSFTQGFKAMVPAILILTFAWTISGIMGAKGGYLNAAGFVEANVAKIPKEISSLFPAIFFAIACGIAFATGTSWGTFGILLPIAGPVVQSSPVLFSLTISAILGGAVFGDHVSPISDTTIMASTGAACNHIDHVKTQLPYASIVAIIAFLAYIVAGYVSSLGSVLCAAIMWSVVAVLFIGTLFILKFTQKKKVQE